MKKSKNLNEPINPKLKYLLTVSLVALFMGSIAWVRLEIVRISYDIHDLEKQEQQTRDEVNKITFKINEARAPDRLERLATDKFSMRKPKPEQLITL